MSIEPKFGIIAFLDALGARTTDIKICGEYLDKVQKLETSIKNIKKALEELDQMEEHQNSKWNPQFLKLRFFGDSILLSYEFPSGSSYEDSILCVIFTISALICFAIRLGVLFRGALSIGKYLETEAVLLGPAITDAANWYELSDMIGMMVTPATYNFLNATYKLDSKRREKALDQPAFGLLLHDIPISKSARIDTKQINSYVIDWPRMIREIQREDEPNDELLWFYNYVKSLTVPLGAESKYTNTEKFIIKSMKISPREETEKTQKEPTTSGQKTT